jgi:hypothetical protein
VRYTELAPDRFRDFWRDCIGRPSVYRALNADG